MNTKEATEIGKNAIEIEESMKLNAKQIYLAEVLNYLQYLFFFFLFVSTGKCCMSKCLYVVVLVAN